MKVFIAFLLLTIVCQPCFSQLKRIEKLFQKGKYEKCIELVKKNRADGKNINLLNYYQCKSYFSLFGLHRDNLVYLDKTISFYSPLIKSRTFTDTSFTERLKQELERTSDSLYTIKNHSKSKQYVRLLALTFKDTVQLYTYYYPKKELQKKIELTTGAEKSKDKLTSVPSISRRSIIQYAEIFQSIPYKWGGEDSTGFDCSGFVLKVMKNYGYSFNHGARDQSELGFEIPREQLKEGDLVFFGKRYANGRCKIDHVAIAHTVDKNTLTVIHSTSKGVNIQELKQNDYWGKKILFYRNIIDQGIKIN
jgi:probable lipoprotein NlpC